MPLPRYLTLTLFLLIITATIPSMAQEASTPTVSGGQELMVDGLVIDRQKYSFTLQTGDRNYQVSIPNGTPILMKLTRPGIDLANRRLSMTLDLSSPDGDPQNNQALSWELPDPLYVSMQFRDQAERDRVYGQQVRNLDRFVLSSAPPADGPMSFGGILINSQRPGQYMVDQQSQLYSVTLGRRRGLMSGFSILALKPGETSVLVQGRADGDAIVATRIRFEYFGNPLAQFQAGLPNCLSLGDMTSYNYDRALKEALSGKANIFHPPATTGASSNWTRLHHYVGDMRSAHQPWDVIAFNFGRRDRIESKVEWQSNLRQAIRLLERTGARLVWITCTPLPEGLSTVPNRPPGYEPGGMKQQNEWAAEVVAEFPDVIVCDLWQVVRHDSPGIYEGWWSDPYPQFDYFESVPLARCLARHMMAAAGKSPDDINPMSVHQPQGSNNASR
ncbi:MAG: SGNH/GDSL hydrolase family protein [Pirellulaceae bacterium]